MAPCLRLLLLLLPAGCATPAEREAAALREAMTSGRASLAATAPPASVAAAAALPRLRAGGTGLPPAAAAELLGLTPDVLRRRLGEPSLRRAEGPAEIWLYAGLGCALDLILYPEAGRLRVAHAAARASGAEPRTEAACLAGIAGGAERAAAGERA